MLCQAGSARCAARAHVAGVTAAHVGDDGGASVRERRAADGEAAGAFHVSVIIARYSESWRHCQRQRSCMPHARRPCAWVLESAGLVCAVSCSTQCRMTARITRLILLAPLLLGQPGRARTTLRTACCTAYRQSSYYSASEQASVR